jgi:hypothetical protein
MTPLDASFQANGRAANIVEPGDLVEIVFTAPPPQASSVQVQLIETAGPGDAVTTDRLICTFRGSISASKFKLDGPSGDPLTPDKPNPEIATFNKSTDPPKFKVKFKDDSTVSEIPLPDVEEENGSYELKLKITGTAGSTAVTSTGTAILNLRVWRDVMIVPDIASATAAQKKSGEFSIFRDNSMFAGQWKKFAGARRQTMTIPIDGTLTDFETTVTAAAAKATGGDVLLFVGHGGAGDFRGLTITTFDSTPASVHGMNNHPNAINSDVLKLPEIATKNASGQWIANPSTATDAQAKVDALAPRFDCLTRLGAVLKQSKVKRFIVMSCNMARDGAFGFKLAKVLQTTVGGYQKLLSTNQEVFSTPGKPDKTLVQVWLMSQDDPQPGVTDPNQPPGTDENAAPFHEIPGSLKEFAPPAPAKP